MKESFCRERLLCTAAGSTRDGDRPSAAHPRLGGVSFLHRFGSALNHHVHLHACATDGVFIPTGDGPPALLRASRLPKIAAGSVDHPGRPGRAHREGAPSCRALVPHAAAPPPVSPARGPPTDWAELVQVHDDRAIFQASPDFSARHRHPQPLPAFHATVRTACKKSGFKAGSSQREKFDREHG
jgi:hypothetical protein